MLLLNFNLIIQSRISIVMFWRPSFLRYNVCVYIFLSKSLRMNCLLIGWDFTIFAHAMAISYMYLHTHTHTHTHTVANTSNDLAIARQIQRDLNRRDPQATTTTDTQRSVATAAEGRDPPTTMRSNYSYRGNIERAYFLGEEDKYTYEHGYELGRGNYHRTSGLHIGFFLGGRGGGDC